jgi:hypothetical protein
MRQAEFDRLVKEIQDVGFIDPVQVVPLDTGKYRIIGGEHRVAAARELKMEKVPAMILEGPKWASESVQKLVTVRLNVLKGKLNPEKMAVLYNEMATQYGEAALKDLFAFVDSNAWDAVVKQVKHGLAKAGLPKEKRREFDKKAKEAKTLQDLERILNEIWSSYGDTVQLSFMIFTYGTREHTYISMDKQTRAALRRITDYCKVGAKDINAVIGPALCALADVLAVGKTPAPAPVSENDDGDDAPQF